jgi:hypothetical protein
MSVIRIFRPKKPWSVSPATVLPTAVIFRLFKPASSFTVVLDGEPVGTIGKDEMRVFQVEPGEHRLYMRFVGLRRSAELRVSLKVGEERQLVCGTSAMGWPTLSEASPEEVAVIRKTLKNEPPAPGDSAAPI